MFVQTSLPVSKLHILSLMGLEDETSGGLSPIYRVRIDLLAADTLTSSNIGVMNEFNLSNTGGAWSIAVTSAGQTHYFYEVFDQGNQKSTINLVITS